MLKNIFTFPRVQGISIVSANEARACLCIAFPLPLPPIFVSYIQPAKAALNKKKSDSSLPVC